MTAMFSDNSIFAIYMYKTEESIPSHFLLSTKQDEIVPKTDYETVHSELLVFCLQCTLIGGHMFSETL